MNDRTRPRIGASMPVLRWLMEIAEKHPDLPAVYLPIHMSPIFVDVQCLTLADFESWREGLNVDPKKISLSGSLLQAEVPGLPFAVKIYAFGALTADHRDASERIPELDSNPHIPAQPTAEDNR